MWYSILEPERTDTISGLCLDVTLRALQESFGERLKRLENASGVYFLLDENDALVYVGQAANIHSRIEAHHSDKRKRGKFLRVYYMDAANREERLDFERRLIHQFKPELNRTLPATNVSAYRK